MFALFDAFLGPLVRQLCPSSAPGQIDYLILNFYLSFVLIAALLLSLASLFRRLFGSPPSPSPIWADEQQTVDVYLDWDAFGHVDLPVHAILDAIRAAVDGCWALGGPERRARLVFSCYVDRAHQTRASVVAQLEALEHSSDGSVLLIDTAPSRLLPHDDLSLPAKPLLHDLLKFDSLSTGRRLYVVSTADEALCDHGLALLKTHPCAPLLCYVPPFGLAGKMPEPAAADLVFRWEDGQVVVCEERVGVVDGPCGRPELAEFHPILLLLRAYGTSLPLRTLVAALTAWFFDPDRTAEDRAEEVDRYIEAAVAKGVVVLSCQPMGVDGAYEDVMVVSLGQQALASSPPFAKDLTPDPAERSGADEDRLTTTGSDSEDVSSKQSDSPTLRGKLAAALNETLLASRQADEQQTESRWPDGKPQKHKQPASETGPPVKKKKKQAGGGSPPAMFRVVSKTRRRSLRKASPAPEKTELLGTGGLLPAVELGLAKEPEWTGLEERELEDHGLDERGLDSPPHNAARSRPRSIELGTAAVGSPDGQPPGSLPAYLHSLPCSPGLWMHTSSGLVDGARAPMSSLGFGSLYGRNRKGMAGGEETSSANERFAMMFSPKIRTESVKRGVTGGVGGYPFPMVVDEEVMDVD